MSETCDESPVAEYVAPAPAVTLSAPSQQLHPAYTMKTVTTDDNFDTTGLVHPQFSFTAVEVSAPQAVGSLSPLEEFDAPVYNQIHQELIVAGETTQHRVENPAVQEQVIYQEIPQAPQVVDPFPPLEEFVAPMSNQVLQWQIVATVQPHVRFQEISEVQVVERIQVSQTTLNTSSTSTSSGVPAATHAATALAAAVDIPLPPIPDDEQMLGYQAKIDQCVHMLKTRKEVIARHEKQVAALLERVPLAVSSRDKRALQKPVDECIALILHQHQLVPTVKEKLASLMWEMQEKREHAYTKHFVGPEEKNEAQTLTSLPSFAEREIAQNVPQHCVSSSWIITHSSIRLSRTDHC